MKRFQIIPVIDLLNSQAVHAQKGERTKYRPLKSHLFSSSNPLEIITLLKKKYNFDFFYIADLDSIIRKVPNIHLLKKIVAIPNLKVILDPGIVDLKDIYQFLKIKIKNLILGLETIKNFNIIIQSLHLLNPDNIFISIDMYKGKIISNACDIKNQNPITLMEELESNGIKNVILLDLFRVGQKIGGIPSLYLDLLDHFNGNVFVGGGIKNLEDLLSIKEQNFSGVLIATALYDGTLDIEKLRAFD